MATRPAIFKWRQTEPVLILCAVRWYLRYSLSLRDVEELLDERGLQVTHTTVWRWVQLCVANTESGEGKAAGANVAKRSAVVQFGKVLTNGVLRT